MGSDWIEYKFKDLLSEPVRNGIYKKKEFHGRGAKIVNMGELFRFPRLFDEEMKRVELTEKEIPKVLLEQGDLLFARRSLTAEGAGKCSIVKSINEPTTFESSIIRGRPNSEIVDSDYLYYFFYSPQGKYLVGSILRQVAVSGITGTDLMQLPMKIAPLPEQKAIAHILGSLDDKIELNRQMNETLESMAQALFKSWFVDFDPVIDNALAAGNPIPDVFSERAEQRRELNANTEKSTSSPNNGDIIELSVSENETASSLKSGGVSFNGSENSHPSLFPSEFEYTEEMGWIPKGWSVSSLDGIANYLNGLALQKFRPEDETNYLPILKIAQLRSGKATHDEKASPNIKPEYIVTDGDIIFSWSGSLLVDVWCGGRAALNQHLFKVTSDNFPKWFYLSYTKYHLKEFQRIATDKAVTMGHIKRSHLKEALCLIPKQSIIDIGSKQLQPIINKQIKLRLENRSLEKLRDTLLPKLLSGELRIPDVEKLIEELL